MAQKESDVFEFAGRKFLTSGTSGRNESRTQIAPGAPVRHELTFAGRRLEISGTSGPHNKPIPTAPGRPVPGNLGQHAGTALSSSPSGFRLIGGATRNS